MTIGSYKTLTLNACIPDNYHVKWSTGNERIADVDPDTGVVHAKQPGRILITAKCQEEESIRTTISLTVSPTGAPTSGIDPNNVYMIKNAGKPKYLRADSEDSLSVAAKDEMDGKQLWYVRLTTTGYVLYSMGIKDASTYGAQEMMLSYSEISSLHIDDEDCSACGWSISYYNGYYYLTNRDSQYNNMSVATNNSNDSVNGISLNNETLYAAWEFEKIEKATFNNYWALGYLTTGTEKHIKINICDSDTDPESVYYNNIFEEDDFSGLDIWENYSDNIVIYGIDEDVPPEVTSYIEIDIVGGDPEESPESGDITAARTIGYVGTTRKGLNEYWGRVKIVINTTSAAEDVLNGDDKAYLRKKILLHEMGHALKLAHPKNIEYTQAVPNARWNYPNDNSVVSIMNQADPYNTSNLTCNHIKYHDIINLQNKWN